MLANWVSRSCHAATSSFLFFADSPVEVNLISNLKVGLSMYANDFNGEIVVNTESLAGSNAQSVVEFLS